jgi:hypothetical protein
MGSLLPRRRRSHPVSCNDDVDLLVAMASFHTIVSHNAVSYAVPIGTPSPPRSVSSGLARAAVFAACLNTSVDPMVPQRASQPKELLLDKQVRAACPVLLLILVTDESGLFLCRRCARTPLRYMLRQSRIAPPCKPIGSVTRARGLRCALIAIIVGSVTVTVHQRRGVAELLDCHVCTPRGAAVV